MTQPSQMCSNSISDAISLFFLRRYVAEVANSQVPGPVVSVKPSTSSKPSVAYTAGNLGIDVLNIKPLVGPTSPSRPKTGLPPPPPNPHGIPELNNASSAPKLVAGPISAKVCGLPALNPALRLSLKPREASDGPLSTRLPGSAKRSLTLSGRASLTATTAGGTPLTSELRLPQDEHVEFGAMDRSLVQAGAPSVAGRRASKLQQLAAAEMDGPSALHS
jgi:hypothetical protein